MLHKLNPVRLRFVRDKINDHWGCDTRERFPLKGKTSLDVGCGAGLMTEAVARMGAQATGLDAVPESIKVAAAHAEAQGLSIHYLCEDVAQSQGQYDLVTSMEVIEHVADPALFIASLAARLAPGGLMVLSTPNRTRLSKLGLITIGEGLGQIPKGTHHWDMFLTPEELTALVEAAGLAATQVRGLSFSPAKGFALSDDLSLNYLMAVEHRS